jgi:hypothetical protein
MKTFLELYNKNELGGYQLVIPKDTMKYGLDYGDHMKKSGKTEKLQRLPILWMKDSKIGALENNSNDFVTRFWVDEDRGTEYLKIIDYKISTKIRENNRFYQVSDVFYKASDVRVTEIPTTPTFEDKERKKDLLSEFRNVVEVAKAEPPGESSNYPFSSEDYYEAEKDFEEQKKRQSSLKIRGGRRGGRRTRRRRRKSKK